MTPPSDDALGQPLPSRENRFRRAFLLAFVLAITVIFLGMIRAFLMTILLAAIFAGLAYPLYERLATAFRGRRPLAALTTLVIGLGSVTLPLGFVLYMATAEAVRLSEDLRPWLAEVAQRPVSVGPLLDRVPFAEHLYPYRDTILAKAGEVAGMIGGFVVSSLSSTTVGTVQMVFQLVIMAYTAFFFLLDGRELLWTVRKFLPLRDGERDLLLGKFLSVTRATIKGTLVIGVIQGTMSGIAFWVVGIPHAVLWGAIMVVMSVVPVIGAASVWVPAAIVLAISGHWMKAIGLAAFCSLIVGSVDNVLRPRLVGRDTEMHDLMILFSTLGGIAVFGAIGFIVGPIIAALFQTAWELFGVAYQDFLPPAPEPPPEMDAEAAEADAPESDGEGHATKA